MSRLCPGVRIDCGPPAGIDVALAVIAAFTGDGCAGFGVDTIRATRSADMDARGACGASASASAFTSGNRSSGFFCRHRMTAATRSAGSTGRSSASDVGASWKMRDATCIGLSPTYGGRPASPS